MKYCHLQQHGWTLDLENIMLSEISQKKLRTIWFHSHVGWKTETHRHRQQYGGYQREGGWGVVKGQECQIYMVMEDDLTLGGGHTMQYSDHVL